MAWNHKPPTAKELIGMEPDELKTKLEGAATKTDLEALTTGQNELKSTLATITAALQGLKGNNDPAPTVDPGSGDPSLDILTDPDKYVAGKIQPIAAQQDEMGAQMQEMRARQNPKFAGIFTQYGEDLMKSAAKFPASMRKRDDFWASHIRMTLGDKFIAGEIREGSFPSLIGATSLGTNTGGGANDPDMGFDRVVADFLRDKGVPLQRARKVQDLMSQGEPISMATMGKVGNA